MGEEASHTLCWQWELPREYGWGHADLQQRKDGHSQKGEAQRELVFLWLHAGVADGTLLSSCFSIAQMRAYNAPGAAKVEQERTGARASLRRRMLCYTKIIE